MVGGNKVSLILLFLRVFVVVDGEEDGLFLSWLEGEDGRGDGEYVAEVACCGKGDVFQCGVPLVSEREESFKGGCFGECFVDAGVIGGEGEWFLWSCHDWLLFLRWGECGVNRNGIRFFVLEGDGVWWCGKVAGVNEESECSFCSFVEKLRPLVGMRYPFWRGDDNFGALSFVGEFYADLPALF